MRGQEAASGGAGGASGKSNGWGNGRAAGREHSSSVKRVARPCLGTWPGPISLPLPAQVATASCLSHGFPEAGQRAGSPSYGYPQLATRLAAETGAVVLTFDFRGMGSSGGDFSLSGWRADLVTGMRTFREVPGVEEIWLVGFAAGGTLSICAAGEDPSIAGVAALAPPAEFARARQRSAPPCRPGQGDRLDPCQGVPAGPGCLGPGAAAATADTARSQNPPAPATHRGRGQRRRRPHDGRPRAGGCGRRSR